MSKPQDISEILKAELEAFMSRHRLATLMDIRRMEHRIMAFEDDELAAINGLSTAADTISLKADKIQADMTALIDLVKAAVPTPSQALKDAIAKAVASTAALATAGDKVDAAVAAADAVLPKPAPPGNP